MRTLLIASYPLSPAVEPQQKRVLGFANALAAFDETLVLAPAPSAPTGAYWAELPASSPSGKTSIQKMTSLFRGHSSRETEQVALEHAAGFSPDLVIAQDLESTPIAARVAERMGINWGTTVPDDAVQTRAESLSGSYSRLARQRIEVLQHAPFLIVDHEERVEILNQLLHGRELDIMVCPDAVETSKQPTAARLSQARSVMGIRPSEPVVLYMGSLNHASDWRSITEFVNQLLPHLGDFPGIRWIMPAGFRDDRLPPPFEPLTIPEDDYAPHFLADICIDPALDSTDPYKILESLAAGKPTVASFQAAMNLDLENGEEILLADSIDGYITSLHRIIGSRGVGEGLAAKGLEYIKASHSWETVMPSLLPRLKNMANQPIHFSH